jgi:GDP-D-mannose 3',5'-epimerase
MHRSTDSSPNAARPRAICRSAPDPRGGSHHSDIITGIAAQDEERRMGTSTRILVTGAGGFIGHHLVNRLKADGHWVRGADLTPPDYAPSKADEFLVLDLRRPQDCERATRGVTEVYHLAADMGGIGYITASHAAIARHNVLIDAHMLEASRTNGVARFLYSSSACIYPQHRQQQTDSAPLREEDAWPADPEPGYGLEKLYMEKLCEYYWLDYGFETRVVRFHNVYGPFGAYEGGKEKSPAAICRKVALAAEGGEIEIWGDGRQTRSYMYIDDCVEGLVRLMRSAHRAPLNLGTDRAVSIDGLVDIVCAIAGKRLTRRYDLSRPQGVRGRNSDNTRLLEVFGWAPSVPLEEGLRATYRWIEEQVLRPLTVPISRSL